jgi:peptidoglycan/LPS O-acetylase OafA/YrhL
VLPSLTGIRGLAASAVFLSHIGYLVGATAVGDVWREIRPVGIAGVLCFFVLSGYLLAQPSSLRGGGWSYLRRRLARIYPVYLLALAATVLFVAVREPGSSLLEPGTVLLNLVLGQSWPAAGQDLSISLPAWSLSVELLFYLVLPLVLPVATVWFRSAPRSSFVLLLVLASLGGAALQYGWTGPTFPPAFLPVFLLGVHAAVTGARGPRPAVAVALALAGTVGFVLYPNVVLAAAGFTALVAGLATADRSGRPPLAAPAWHAFGVWSYAFFLLHVLVIDVVGVLLGGRPGSVLVGVGAAAVAFSLSWVLAAGAYRYVEEPARRLLTRQRGPVPPAGVLVDEPRSGAAVR